MTGTDNTRRIDALEERIAYQDEAIETLNQAITKQWAQIDALTRQLAQLGERLREAETRVVAGTHGDTPPPHY